MGKSYQPGEEVARGKTKVVEYEPHVVSFKMLDQLTGGDAARKETIPGMGAMNATQIANCMGVLTRWGIPNAFIGQTSPDELLCWGCDMVKLECVMRRRAWGSALQREPQLKNRRRPPHRFDPLRLEFFHKDSVVTIDGGPRLMPEEEARQLYLRQDRQ
jgi:phosphoribosylaminoimidazole-succinocarboxamide synthase